LKKKGYCLFFMMVEMTISPFFNAAFFSEYKKSINLYQNTHLANLQEFLFNCLSCPEYGKLQFIGS